MINFKNEIAKIILNAIKLDENEVYMNIETPKNVNNGDYAFPCFFLAKKMKKSPQDIATEIKANIKLTDNKIEKIETLGGYINFFINKEILVKEVLEEIEKNTLGKSNIGDGENVIIEYSSPNIAKPFHVGHLRTTLIGNALYKIYKYLGFNTTGINHLGDYGTQFGKMIEAYKLWGKEYNLENNPIDKMVEMYVKINDLCKKDEEVLKRCRENFKKLENGEEFETDLWERFRALSLKEFNKIYDLFNIKFDSIKGESFYADKIDKVLEILENKKKTKESNGAIIVDLEEEKIDTPCIVKKADGTSIYATRDLAAIIYRAEKYNFNKCLYVVAYEQNLYFKQIFTVAKYLVDEKYAKGLQHVSYGMVSLPTGKMSTRLGNVIKIEDLIQETLKKAEEIIIQKNPLIENKNEISKAVGLGAIIFNTLSTSNIKDQVFDWDVALNFQGETGPYIQYTYVRTKSILEKIECIPKLKDIDLKYLLDDYSIQIIKTLYQFEETLNEIIEKNEPSILARYLIDLSKQFSIFYNECKVINENKKIQDARIFLTYAVGKVLKLGANLLGMEMPVKM